MSMPPPPPPPVTAQPIAVPTGPSRKWYLVPTLLLILIVVPSLLAFLSGLDGLRNGLTRVRVPGETQVTLEEGNWTVFYEWRGEFEGETFTTSSAFPGMQAVLFSETGEEIPVGPSVGDINYNFGNTAGFAVGRFEIEEPGDYAFAATTADGGEYVLALGKDIGRSTVKLVVGIFGMIAGGGIAFVVWLIIFLVRILRARKSRDAASYGAA